MYKKLSLAAVISAAAVSATPALSQHTGPFGFEPIDGSANAADWNPLAPWKIPEGFSQSVVSDETDLNLYDGGVTDWPDMNTVNETGRQAGRYLYRTHENRSVPGAVTVVDLKSGDTELLWPKSLDGLNPGDEEYYIALDGIRWTPWGTILFAEETTGGRLLELVLDKNNPMSGTAHDRPAVGRLAHEGIEVGPDGAIYLVDEWRGLSSSSGTPTTCAYMGETITPCGGGIYKFVPYSRGDLSNGDLYVLGVSGGPNGTGQGEWIGPIDPEFAREDGSKQGGASYQRPEDLEIIDHTLYVAITEGPRDSSGKEIFEGRVLSVDLNSLQVQNFVIAPANVPVEIGKPGDAGHQSGFDSVDNLATTPDGKLMMVEDNSPSDIWVADKDHDNDGLADNVWLFGSLTDPGAEATGIYFGKESKTLFVNIQHSAAADGDGTWAITKEK